MFWILENYRNCYNFLKDFIHIEEKKIFLKMVRTNFEWFQRDLRLFRVLINHWKLKRSLQRGLNKTELYLTGLDTEPEIRLGNNQNFSLIFWEISKIHNFLVFRWNSKRRHWRRTKLHINWLPILKIFCSMYYKNEIFKFSNLPLKKKLT